MQICIFLLKGKCGNILLLAPPLLVTPFVGKKSVSAHYLPGCGEYPQSVDTGQNNLLDILLLWWGAIWGNDWEIRGC